MTITGFGTIGAMKPAVTNRQVYELALDVLRLTESVSESLDECSVIAKSIIVDGEVYRAQRAELKRKYP